MTTRAIDRNPRLKRNLKRMLILLAIALIGWFVFAWFIQRLLLFPTWAMPPAADAAAPAGAQVIWLEPEANVKVEAWLFSGKGATAAHPGPLVIYAHGNAERIDNWAGELQPYVEHGISVLLIEYRSYGRSTGSPSQKNIVWDYIKFHDQIITRPDVDPARIIYHGRSLGGGVLGALTAVRPPAALILESTFTHIAPLAWRYALPGFMVRDPMNTRQALTKYKGPVLIIHGQKDEVIPVANAHANHKACPQSELIIEPLMTHNSGPASQEIYWKNIFTFVDKSIKPKG